MILSFVIEGEFWLVVKFNNFSFRFNCLIIFFYCLLLFRKLVVFGSCKLFCFGFIEGWFLCISFLKYLLIVILESDVSFWELGVLFVGFVIGNNGEFKSIVKGFWVMI